MWDDEEIGDFTADPLHSLLGVLASPTASGIPDHALLQETGSAILQENGSFILLDT